MISAKRSSLPIQLQPAFTLVELLVVVAIVMILMAFVIPAVGPLLRSSSVNKAAAMITDELTLARQLALAQNRNVEVRFYRLGSKTSSSELQFRAFRSFYADGNEPVSGVKHLSEPVIISADPRVTTLLIDSDSSRSGKEILPGIGETPYVGFMFRPTGGTNLKPVEDNWFLTVHLQNSPKNATTGIPDNYFTAQIDAVTGRVRTYRP